MWQTALQFIIITDLAINFFFHLIQLREWMHSKMDLAEIHRKLDGVTTEVREISSRHPPRLLRQSHSFISEESVGAASTQQGSAQSNDADHEGTSFHDIRKN